MSANWWHPWNGGDCPVRPDINVYCILRSSRAAVLLLAPLKADYVSWKHCDVPDSPLCAYDIVAYRIADGL